MKRAVYIVTSMDAGGAETVFMKFYRALDKSKYQLDFCVSSDEPGFYDDEIRELGGRIMHTVKKSECGPVASFRRLRDIAREGGYCAAVRSSQHSLSALDLLAMRAGGVPRTVFRSSNTGTVTNSNKEAALHRMFRPLIGLAATSYAAPSTEAGLYMFGKLGVSSGKFSILHNAVDLAEFAYREDARKEIRRELGIPESALVVGHVGRFNQQKNHAFLLDVFAEVASKRDDSVLLLLGKGELVENVKQKVEALDLSDRVVFAGVRRDAALCYSAMDVLAFPSLYEGLPNVVIEAQANGLPCVMSDTITKEVLLNPNVVQMGLTRDCAAWAVEIIDNAKARITSSKVQLKSKGYDIDTELSRFVSVVYGE